MPAAVTAAHDETVTHRYLVHYPAHPPRPDDPHYVDFDAYHRATRPSARCYVGERIGFDECRDVHGDRCVIDPQGAMTGLELHHAHIEFALQNGVDLAALEHDYPGVSNREHVGAWVESAKNLRWLCVHHHRGVGGAHLLTHSDWEAGLYVPGLTGRAP